jgi:hypothetical protein
MQCRAWRSDEVAGENKDLWHGESAGDPEVTNSAKLNSGAD